MLDEPRMLRPKRWMRPECPSPLWAPGCDSSLAGLIVLLFASYLVWKEHEYGRMSEAQLGELLSWPFSGRYVLLLMGCFSIYCGLIYNDTFGLMANLFGSAFDESKLVGTLAVADGASTDPLGASVGGRPANWPQPGVVYPFGLDPAWHHTENELSFANSYKMKLSIILGVLQMLLGLFCSLLNARHFESAIDIWCVFVPQAIFMLSVFGYLCVAIVYKWAIDWVALSLRPPSLISMLIAFAMSPGTVPADAVLFDGQEYVQLVLFLMAFVAVPWMLLAKPLLLYRQHQATAGYQQMEHAGAHGEEGFDFGEEMMHSVIHTIEYVLGCVSNTASYLRLWALSLAHKQLSAVFYDMILLEQGFGRCEASDGSSYSFDFALRPKAASDRPAFEAEFDVQPSTLVCGVSIVLAFGLWLCVTIGILCCMELLSAFLHALRLHWVEFQNKFYKVRCGETAPCTCALVLVPALVRACTRALGFARAAPVSKCRSHAADTTLVCLPVALGWQSRAWARACAVCARPCACVSHHQRLPLSATLTQ